MTPIFAYLVCESVNGNGLQALILTGMLQGIYGLENLEASKKSVVTSTVRYVAYLMRQIGCVIVGMMAPFYF
mgnify:CR=1 FL=1